MVGLFGEMRACRVSPVSRRPFALDQAGLTDGHDPSPPDSRPVQCSANSHDQIESLDQLTARLAPDHSVGAGGSWRP